MPNRINQEINIGQLVPFTNHPFKLYEGQRFTDMVESIRANGVITPIIVRPATDGKYEILSGHNRASAAKEAGLENIPAVVYEGLSDDEAMLIVTETNLVQRSFADLPHSERAVALSIHYDAMKKKSGYRTDLITEIDSLTCAPVGHRTRTRDKLSEQYGLSKNTVARYLRINKLSSALKQCLDSGNIGMRVAEALSYLRLNEQEIVEEVLAVGKRITIKQADSLEKASQEGVLSNELIMETLEAKSDSTTYIEPVVISSEFLAQYFTKGQSNQKIKKILDKALVMYFEKFPQVSKNYVGNVSALDPDVED